MADMLPKQGCDGLASSMLAQREIDMDGLGSKRIRAASPAQRSNMSFVVDPVSHKATNISTFHALGTVASAGEHLFLLLTGQFDVPVPVQYDIFGHLVPGPWSLGPPLS